MGGGTPISGHFRWGASPMKRGPAPLPRAVKENRGNPGKRPLNNREPKPVEGAPSCPSFMSKEARAHWRRIVPLLRDMGVLAKCDIGVLAAYCESFAEFKQASIELQEGGKLTFTTDKGNVIPHPLVGIKNTAARNMHRFAQDFGLTPAARTRIEIMAAPPEVDEFDEFLGGAVIGKVGKSA